MNYRMAKLALLLAVVSTVTGCFVRPGKHNLPPAQQLMEPGPGVGGPGPGVMMGSGMPGPIMPPMTARSSQIHFIGPAGTVVNWDASAPSMFDSEPLVAPGRQSFSQGAIYRLKLSSVPGREGVELYPTIEVAPENPRTEAFLAHNPIPVQFTEEDFDQVASSNFVTKVIYVPDPEFQEMAVAGVHELVSTRLDPGQDPVTEAARRGSILAIVRMGNIDLEVPGTEGGAQPYDGMIQQAAFDNGGGYAGDMAMGGAYPGMMMGPAPMAMNQVGPVSGYNMQPYGMPSSGTPIGLPGPPHIPLGIQAGLQSHTIQNNTNYRIPNPVDNFKMTVEQAPAQSYPKPVSRMHIKERSFAPGLFFRNPFKNLLQMAP